MPPVATLTARRFDLRATLESGQFFRWTPDGAGFVVHHGARCFRVRQQGDRLDVDGADARPVRDFFALDHDAAAIERVLRRDPRLGPAVDACRGLRILRQDPWECTAAFILSICSNIPRITGNVADIARAWGEPVAREGFSGHAFPRPGRLGGEAALRRLRVGFRARYLVEAERFAREGLLERVAGLPYEKAKGALLEVPGIAEKVADCVLLFAYGHLNAFPVDTWIRKVMIRTYFGGRRVPDRAIRAFAQERWGNLAGYAQQYLYAWSRSMKQTVCFMEVP
jgi:N-glycosylase/DNA lyase